VALCVALRYVGRVARPLIVSQDTVCSLLEAHASLAAWYYKLADALRAKGEGVEPPDEAERLAYLQQIGAHFPEVAEVARTIQHPRPYLPPPAVLAAPAVVAAPPVPNAETGPALPAMPALVPGAPRAGMVAEAEPATPAQSGAGAGSSAPPPPPPPLVDPSKVKYD
jgi:hypothetical protein